MSEAGRVLIVEDDAALMRGLHDNFVTAGYEVNTATDGQLGLTQALTQPFDLIILDIMLPQLNGYDLCRQVRKSKIDTAILMLTGKGARRRNCSRIRIGGRRLHDEAIWYPRAVGQVQTIATPSRW